MLIYVLMALALWVAFVWFAQRAVLFPRHVIAVPPEASLPPGDERWELATDAGPVEAWFLPGVGVSDDEPGPAVIFAHGNGEIIDFWPGELARYRQMGVSVLLPEYRGYGRSAGRPSQRAITEDFIAFYDRLVEHPQVDDARIVYHGRSVGSGVLASLAEHRAPAAIICESSFTSAAAIARRFLVPRFLMRDPLDVRPVLERYTGPVLILHGGSDSIIPPRHAERLHDAAPDSELILYDGVGHNDPMPRQRYWHDIGAFLERAGIVTEDAAAAPHH